MRDCGQLGEYGWVGGGFAVGGAGDCDVVSLGIDECNVQVRKRVCWSGFVEVDKCIGK